MIKSGPLSQNRKWVYTIFVLFFLLVLSLGVLAYTSFSLYKKNIGLKENIQALNVENSNLDQSLGDARSRLRDLEEKNRVILSDLEEKIEKVQGLESKVGDVTGALDDVTDTIDKIQKLNNLDPKLLKKYSRVYFLNENYFPKTLSPIPEDYDFPDGEKELFHAKALPFLSKLIAEAKENNKELSIISAYRSFGEQKSLNDRYTVVFGQETANSFSAEQGYSEHQLGTTIDFTTSAIGTNFSTFGNTPAYEWLKKNAYKYGFILSYPENNSYYTYEPWHWRFVGKELAEYLHENDMYFYEMPQDKIDEYLISVFDE